MTHDDRIEQLLAEHAAAQECGLLQPGPTPAEAARVLEPARPAAQPIRKHSFVTRSFFERFGWNIAIAATLLLAAGLWVAKAGRLNPAVPDATMIAQDKAEFISATFFDGRARIVPVMSDTRFTVTDAAHGKVRLDQGEVYVELPAEENMRVEVETPAGTATALGTRFYVHYGRPSAVSTTAMLAVAVLGGIVEVANSHGNAFGRAGEVVVADSDTAPLPQADVAPPPLLQQSDWRSFGRTLGLLHYPEVQADLKLTDEQKSRLLTSGPDERACLHTFFRDLQSSSSEEREAKSEGFRDQLLARLRDVLTHEQQWRFWQIALQQEGYLSLLRNEVGDSLQLTPEQRQDVTLIADGYNDARRRLSHCSHNHGEHLDRAEWTRRRVQLVQETNEAIESVLTDSQKQLWEKMLGKPLTIERRRGWQNNDT